MPHATKHEFYIETPDVYADVYGESITGHLFETSDMLLAAFLLTTGHRPDTVVWSDEGSHAFCHWFFETQETSGEDVRTFMAGEARVEPRDFYRAVNACRSAMIEADPR